MTAPPSDPVLEAALQIIMASQPELNIDEMRRNVSIYSERARNLIAEAARQIDALRTAGHLKGQSDEQ